MTETHMVADRPPPVGVPVLSYSRPYYDLPREWLIREVVVTELEESFWTTYGGGVWMTVESLDYWTELPPVPVEPAVTGVEMEDGTVIDPFTGKHPVVKSGDTLRVYQQPITLK